MVMAFGLWKNYSIWVAIAAGAAASQFGTVWTAIFYGWDPAYAKDVWLAIPVNLISGAILSGLLGFYLAKAVAKTGLVRSAR